MEDKAFERINEGKSNKSLKTDIEIILNVQFAQSNKRNKVQNHSAVA